MVLEWCFCFVKNKLFNTGVLKHSKKIHHLCHLSVSLPFLLLLPPSPALLFFWGVGVDWHWSGDIKESAVRVRWPWSHLGLPGCPPSRLAWASLLSLFTSRLSLRLSGHVLLRSPRPLIRLLSLNFWLSAQSSVIESEGCWSGRDSALATSGNTQKEQQNKRRNQVWLFKSTDNQKNLVYFFFPSFW